MENHISVLTKEVINYLEPEKGGIFVDGTLGAGGHTQALLAKIQDTRNNRSSKTQILNPKFQPKADPPLADKIIAIDVDETAIQLAKKNLAQYKGQVIFVHDNFVNMKTIVRKTLKVDNPNEKINGILLDLGLSSMQLDSSGRGFSFRKNEPLDMRFGTGYEVLGKGELMAEKVVNDYSEEELTRIFFKFGEEGYSRQIARAIVAKRATNKIKTTKELVEVINEAIPKKGKPAKRLYHLGGSAFGGKRHIHFATKIFQALRIEVNQELINLEKTITQAVDLLKPKGRLAIISFHSLEDRIVKNKFREFARGCTCPPELVKYKCACGKKPKARIITKKPIIPKEEEAKSNPRARSAKLRVLEKL